MNRFSSTAIRQGLALLFVIATVAPVLRVSAQEANSAVKVDSETEGVINQSLRYLVERQAPNGAWLGVSGQEQKYPPAITAYALMAFLAAGNLPDEGRYGRNVERGLQYLLSQVSEDGLIGDRSSGQYMYQHGISAIVLAELYGQTRLNTIRPKLERMIKIIVASQNPQGGWRYRPISRDADISVTVLQVVALRAAKNGGLKVPQQTIDDAVTYVRSCYRPESGGFAYQPGQAAGFARTAAAIYSLQVCGKYDDPLVKHGSNYLFSQFSDHERWFTYGNFYAAPAQYMIGGETWSNWYDKLRTLLMKRAKRREGTVYWEGNSSVGPIYETAVNTMILAMPYQYIPLYQR